MFYYCFPPLKKQYYFPQGFTKYSLFISFYQPYTLSGQLAWFCFKFCYWLFTEHQFRTLLPIGQIEEYVPASAILAFNRGTTGAEQKMTILGIDTLTGNQFFIKYAETDIARNNVRNEGNVLSQLSHLDFVPKLQLQIEKTNYTFIQTSVLEGERLTSQDANQQILYVLNQLAQAKVKSKLNYQTSLRSCVAHGDFCPWNIMIEGEKLTVFDWEQAGIYPLGYDLFTWLFQTSFLLRPQKTIIQIIQQNETLIQSYFQALKVANWQNYLHSFASIKLKLETDKNNWKLVTPFQKLIHYAEIL